MDNKVMTCKSLKSNGVKLFERDRYNDGLYASKEDNWFEIITCDIRDLSIFDKINDMMDYVSYHYDMAWDKLKIELLAILGWDVKND